MSGPESSGLVFKNPKTGAEGKARNPSRLKTYRNACLIKLTPLALSL